MFLNVDGLDESLMSPSSICDLADVYPRRDSASLSGTFWDGSPYSDPAQMWFQKDPFCAGYGREKNSTLSITFSTMNPESSSTLFPCERPFSPEPSVLKQSNFGDNLCDDPWRTFLSPDLLSPADVSCSSPLLTGKENTPLLPNSPALNDFPGFSGGTSIWADSPRAKFGTHSQLNRSPVIPDGLTHSSVSMCLPRPPTRSRGQRKGVVLGWGDTTHLQTPISVPSVFRPRSLSRSSEVDAVDPQTLTGSPLHKRRRQSTLSLDSPGIESESLSLDSTDTAASLDDSDSDDYRPSRSPSPKFIRFKAKPSANAKPSPKPAFRTFKRGSGRILKSKKKGSAALALAVVTQIREVKREAETLQVSLDPDSLDPVRVYHEGNYVVKKQKNQPIPVPVPVPNLNKTSRGRKVPFTSNSDSPVPSSVGATSIEYNPVGQLRGSTRSRKKAQTLSASDEPGPGRSFVCVVPGCGKCFVRGEHLKRHVRSIHTNDKPHVCPIEGCHKSFSRRDNLGQHVRVHLQS